MNPIYLHLLAFLFFVNTNIDAQPSNCEQKHHLLNKANSAMLVKILSGQKASVQIDHGSNQDIVVKIELKKQPAEITGLAIDINNQWHGGMNEVGRTYVYRTNDQSGKALVELITEPSEECTGSETEVVITYYPVTGNCFQNFDDAFNYAQTSLMANPVDYVGRDVGFLLDRMERYNINVSSFGRHISHYEAGVYNGVSLYVTPVDCPAGKWFGREMVLIVEFEQKYMQNEVLPIRQKYENNADLDLRDWNIDYRNLLAPKRIKSVELVEVK